jgi:signal recognition particle receptor subunit beta
VQVDFAQRELTVKLVYYGPALSRKTTNLQMLHGFVAPECCGRLMVIDTRDDRTIFFDMLPLQFQSDAGLHLRIKLFTVPGQVMHSATRRMVLANADGVAFVADSQISETRANAASFVDLRKNLEDNGLDIAEMPVVVQFNKRDLPNVRSDREIDELAIHGREPIFKAVATRGEGVLETFLGLAELTWKGLDRAHDLERKLGISRKAFMLDLTSQLRPLGDGGHRT